MKHGAGAESNDCDICLFLAEVVQVSLLDTNEEQKNSLKPENKITTKHVVCNFLRSQLSLEEYFSIESCKSNEVPVVLNGNFSLMFLFKFLLTTLTDFVHVVVDSNMPDIFLDFIIVFD